MNADEFVSLGDVFVHTGKEHIQDCVDFLVSLDILWCGDAVPTKGDVEHYSNSMRDRLGVLITSKSFVFAAEESCRNNQKIEYTDISFGEPVALEDIDSVIF